MVEFVERCAIVILCKTFALKNALLAGFANCGTQKKEVTYCA